MYAMIVWPGSADKFGSRILVGHANNVSHNVEVERMYLLLTTSLVQ